MTRKGFGETLDAISCGELGYGGPCNDFKGSNTHPAPCSVVRCISSRLKTSSAGPMVDMKCNTSLIMSGFVLRCAT